MKIKFGYNIKNVYICNHKNDTIIYKQILKDETMKKTDLTSEQIAKKEAANEKRKQTCLERYGVEFPNRNAEVREKMTQTVLAKYGCHYMQSEDIKEKVKKTNLERYGCESPLSLPSCREGRKNGMIEKYGTEHPMQVAEVKEKVRKTNLERFGVEHSFQAEEVKEKIRQTKNSGLFKSKNYTLPSGRVIQVMGFENLFLDDYYLGDKREILWDEKVKIEYVFDNKFRVFFPDFCLTDNRLIEVKSKWTFEKDIEQNKAKKIACENMGYSLTFKVYDKGVEVDSEYVNGILCGEVK